jgi:hypothetical protein
MGVLDAVALALLALTVIFAVALCRISKLAGRPEGRSEVLLWGSGIELRSRRVLASPPAERERV